MTKFATMPDEIGLHELPCNIMLGVEATHCVLVRIIHCAFVRITLCDCVGVRHSAFVVSV